MTVLDYGHGTDIGHKSDQNEDSYSADPALGLWLIADGMGGHEAGEVASAIVNETVCQSVNEGKNLADAIHQAHSAVTTASEQGIGAKGMGSTVIALHVKDEKYEIAWVGDSRAYLWNGELQQISRDHSYVQKLLDSGAITREEAITHPNRNIITQSLGGDIQNLTVDHVSGKFIPSQKILLCSDGLSDEVIDEEIAEILKQGDDDQTIVNNLISAALNHGGKDNVTVLLVSAAELISDAESISGAETKILESASSSQEAEAPVSGTMLDSINQKSIIWLATGVGILILIIVLFILLSD